MDSTISALRQVLYALESLPEGSRQLSREVLMAIGWRWERMGCPGGGMWKTSNGGQYCAAMPGVTEDVGAARAVMPEYLSVSARQQAGGSWSVELSEPAPAQASKASGTVVSCAATLPLALCGALIRERLTRLSSAKCVEAGRP